jgi:hypothetical protein
MPLHPLLFKWLIDAVTRHDGSTVLAAATAIAVIAAAGRGR